MLGLSGEYLNLAGFLRLRLDMMVRSTLGIAVAVIAMNGTGLTNRERSSTSFWYPTLKAADFLPAAPLKIQLMICIKYI